MYKLDYLPAARADIGEAIRYIHVDLKNPMAAKQLAREFSQAAERLRIFPFANPVYHGSVPLEQELRKLMVKNYIMFYCVDEEHQVVTITRVLYAGMDYERHLK